MQQCDLIVVVVHTVAVASNIRRRRPSLTARAQRRAALPCWRRRRRRCLRRRRRISLVPDSPRCGRNRHRRSRSLAATTGAPEASRRNTPGEVAVREPRSRLVDRQRRSHNTTSLVCVHVSRSPLAHAGYDDRHDRDAQLRPVWSHRTPRAGHCGASRARVVARVLAKLAPRGGDRPRPDSSSGRLPLRRPGFDRRRRPPETCSSTEPERTAAATAAALFERARQRDLL